MNILILCGHSLKTYAYHDVLSPIKHNLFLFIDKNYEAEIELELLQKNYKKISIFEDYFNNGEVELEAILLNKEFPLDSIVAIREMDILRAARLRDYLGIPGQSFESALGFRNKIIMKEFAKKAGLNIPNFSTISTATDLIDFISQYNYPVFVKPISSAGSIKARALRNENDLRTFLSTDFKNPITFSGYCNDFHVEEYIDGDFYNVDGVIIEGKPIICSPGKYNTHADLEHIRNYGYWSSHMLANDNSLRSKLINYIVKVLSVLPTPSHTAFHSELFIRKTGEITLCEIASRMPGGAMSLALNHAYGIDLFKLSVQFNVNPNEINKNELIQKEKNRRFLTGSVFIHPPEAKFQSAISSCPIGGVVSYHLLAKPNQKYSRGEHSCDGAAMFVVEGKSESELENLIDQCVKWFWNNSIWDNNI